MLEELDENPNNFTDDQKEEILKQVTAQNAALEPLPPDYSLNTIPHVADRTIIVPWKQSTGNVGDLSATQSGGKVPSEIAAVPGVSNITWMRDPKKYFSAGSRAYATTNTGYITEGHEFHGLTALVEQTFPLRITLNNEDKYAYVMLCSLAQIPDDVIKSLGLASKQVTDFNSKYRILFQRFPQDSGWSPLNWSMDRTINDLTFMSDRQDAIDAIKEDPKTKHIVDKSTEDIDKLVTDFFKSGYEIGSDPKKSNPVLRSF